MKLLFPNGEHAPHELKDGVTRVGSGAGSDITIVAPGIAHQHCEITCRGESGSVRPVGDGSVVVVNGRQADGRTRVRMALPKFVLRGVSGTTFGKTYPLFGTVTVGRHSECDISVPGEEISRHHAKLSVMPDGIAVEDLGSANGTFIAGKRVHQGLLKPGEELRLDTVRFLLVAPGMEVQQAAKPATAPAPAAAPPAEKGGGGIGWVVLAVLAVAAVGAAAWYFGLLG